VDKGQSLASEYMRYRFVGGPVHNRLLTVHKDHITIEIPEPIRLKINDPDELQDQLSTKIHRYYKVSFRSEHQSIYYQFIHESKIHNRKPSMECYFEVFPEPFNLINLFKLRGLGVEKER
jgi:hypothetical protein